MQLNTSSKGFAKHCILFLNTFYTTTQLDCNWSLYSNLCFSTAVHTLTSHLTQHAEMDGRHVAICDVCRKTVCITGNTTVLFNHIQTIQSKKNGAAAEKKGKSQGISRLILHSEINILVKVIKCCILYSCANNSYSDRYRV